MEDGALNVAAISRGSRVNGPGLRAVVWVQGCTIGCAGCFNPQTHPHLPRQLFDPVALADELCAIPQIDGITLSGGEPFEQAAACARFAERVRQHALTVLVFSGYTYRALSQSPLAEVQRLLATTDVLVAGPYVRSQARTAHDLRASANQELLALTPAGGRALKSQRPDEPVVELACDGGHLRWSGFPDPADQQWLAQLGSLKADSGRSEPD